MDHDLQETLQAAMSRQSSGRSIIASIPPPPLQSQIEGSWGIIQCLMHLGTKKYPKIHFILDFSPKKSLFTASSQKNKNFLKMVKNAIFGLF